MRRNIALMTAMGWAGFFIAAVSAYPQTDFAMIQKYKASGPVLQEAQKDLERGRIERCQAELEKCFKAVPDHHAAWFLQAQILYKQGDFPSALAAMDKAKAGHQHLVKILSEFQAQKIAKQIDDAEALSEQNLATIADAAKVSCQQDTTYASMLNVNIKSLNGLKRETRENINKKPDAVPAEYEYFAGNCLFKLKRYEEAAASYREAIATDPIHANSYNNLINLLYLAKDYSGARTIIDQAEANKVTVLPGLKKAVLDGAK
jgi:tetratricopeptide (TPR) repeat protein